VGAFLYTPSRLRRPQIGVGIGFSSGSARGLERGPAGNRRSMVSGNKARSRRPVLPTPSELVAGAPWRDAAARAALGIGLSPGIGPARTIAIGEPGPSSAATVHGSAHARGRRQPTADARTAAKAPFMPAGPKRPPRRSAPVSEASPRGPARRAQLDPRSRKRAHRCRAMAPRRGSPDATTVAVAIRAPPKRGRPPRRRGRLTTSHRPSRRSARTRGHSRRKCSQTARLVRCRHRSRVAVGRLPPVIGAPYARALPPPAVRRTRPKHHAARQGHAALSRLAASLTGREQPPGSPLPRVSTTLRVGVWCATQSACRARIGVAHAA